MRSAWSWTATRATAVSLCLSLAMHVGVLGAALWIIGGAAQPRLIRVALLPGGGSGDAAGGGSHGRSGAARVAAAPAPVAVKEQASSKPSRPRVKAAPHRAPGRKVSAQDAERRAPAPHRARKRGTDASGAHVPEPAAAGDRGARIAGAGLGLASGSGSGRGGGVGHGDGDARGDGNGGDSSTDGRALCLRCPEPAYPLMAVRRGWHGTVDVSLIVFPDGSVGDARVRQSSGYTVLDREAVRAARASRFSLPTDRLREPLRTYMKYRFEIAAR